MANYINEYEGVLGYYNGNFYKAERMNAFLTLVYGRETALRGSFKESFIGTHIKVGIARAYFGLNNYKEMLLDTEDFGLERDWDKKSKYGHNLIWFKPIKERLKGKRVPIKGVYLSKNITNLRKLKKKNFSPEALIVSNQQKNVTISCSLSEFTDAIELYYPKYVSRNTALDKNVMALDQYVQNSTYFYNHSQSFNRARGYEKLDYITEDKFSGRVHTVGSNTPKAIKEAGYLKINGNDVVCADLKESQPTIFSLTLEENIGKNSFTDRFNSEDDIYLYIMKTLNLESRDIAKEVLFTMIYGNIYSKGFKQFETMFPDVANYLRTQKSIFNPENPSKLVYSNTVWEMQNKETKIFKKIWVRLNDLGIKFTPVHDEIIAQEKDKDILLYVMNSELEKHFPKFEVKIK